MPQRYIFISHIEKKPSEFRTALVCRCCRDVSGNVSAKGVCDSGVCDSGVCDTGVCDTPLRDYFLMKVFVATPSSVVTRKKYMPLARPLTLMRVGMGE